MDKCLKHLESIIKMSNTNTNREYSRKIHSKWVRNPELFAKYMWQQPLAYHAVKMDYTPRRINMGGSWIPGNLVWYDTGENRLLLPDRTWA